MSSKNFKQFLTLPAIKEWDTETIPLMSYEIALWGKNQDSSSDYKIIAASDAFNLKKADIFKMFYVGDADLSEGSSIFMWKPRSNRVHLASLSMSQRRDNDNRPTLQMVILTSNISTEEIPAPIQALMLLPLLKDKQKRFNNDKSLAENTISPSNHQDIQIKPESLLTAFQKGLECLHNNYNKHQITNFYGALLEGIPAYLSTKQKISEESVGVLLLFLDPIMANSFSIVEELPGSNFEKEKIKKNWAAILRKTTWQEENPKISGNIKHDVESLSSKLMSFKFSDSIKNKQEKSNSPKEALDISSKDDNSTIKLSLWGPPSAGKTVFVSQLYWQGTDSSSDWDIRLLSEDSKQYMSQMYDTIQNKNKFPLGTNLGHDNKIEFLIINEKENIQANLFIEDRAGAHYSGEAEASDGNLKLEESIVEILKQSDGLIFLFDPSREKSILFSEVWNTMQTLQLELSGGRKKIQIPVAVCLTKADNEIDSLEKFNFALKDPDTFVREYAEISLIELLDKYCENYSLFPVSSVGIKVSEYLVEPIVFYDDALESRVVPNDETKTINLLSPFVWLMNATR